MKSLLSAHEMRKRVQSRIASFMDTFTSAAQRDRILEFAKTFRLPRKTCAVDKQ